MNLANHAVQIPQVECDEATAFTQTYDDIDNEDSSDHEKNLPLEKFNYFDFYLNFNLEKVPNKPFSKTFTNSFKNPIKNDCSTNFKRRINQNNIVDNYESTDEKNHYIDSSIDKKLHFFVTPKSETKQRNVEIKINKFTQSPQIKSRFQQNNMNPIYCSNSNFDLKELIKSKRKSSKK